MIVEDEEIIANNIERSLNRMGYEVSAICNSAEGVNIALKEALPDVVLMDIRLEGEEDGVAIAERLRDLYALPVVYLSALMDDETLERAKITQPFGYIAKPFSQRELQITLEIALYKSEIEARLNEQEVHIQKIIDSIKQGFCLIDAERRIRYANRQLSDFIGVAPSEMSGKSLMDYARLPKGVSPEMVKAWQDERPFEILVVTPDGVERTVIITVQHLRNEAGDYNGSFLSVTDLGAIERGK